MTDTDDGDAACAWTPYAELNDLLGDFVKRIGETLSGNLIGIYLQGSFALGDFDEASDVDFVVVTRTDLTLPCVEALNTAHAALYQSTGPWAQHLEGSYAPASVLRRFSLTPRDPPGEPRTSEWRDPESWQAEPRAYPFWFLNNGATKLVRSEHDNSQVVRWVLRERGLALVGPPPTSLLDPVSPTALREETREVMAAVSAQLATIQPWIQTRFGPGYCAVLYARMLHTLASGQVGSKPAAVKFAREALEPRWADLVERGWLERKQYPRGPDAGKISASLPARPSDVADVLAFAAVANEIGSRLGNS